LKPSRSKPISKARILVADDHPLFREGLVQLINRERDLVCCGQADNPAAVQTAVAKEKPDLLVLDLRLKHGDGIEFIKSLTRQFSALPILVLSQHDEMLYAERALRAGARGYVMKEEATDDVLNAIHSILKGELHVSRKMSVVALHKLVAGPAPVQGGGRVERLTDRELQIFQMLGAGLGTRRIAAELHLSFKTVETHRENIKHKMGLRDAASLVRAATQWLTDPGAAAAHVPKRD
jgi:DNA-binding NarL/FixJ family response regulator